jgi:hypothetical protein
MPAQLETAPARALDAILHGPFNGSNPGIILLDYRHKQTFIDLWTKGLESQNPTIDGQPYDWTDGTKQILIIGNDPPVGAFDFLRRAGMPPVNVQQHLSACSWAAAFRLIHPDARIHIVIVSAAPVTTREGAAADLASVFGGTDCGSGTVPGVTVLCSPRLEQIARAIQSPSPPKLTTGQMGILRGIIQQHLLPNAEDHHKMGNIVGALMLEPKPTDGIRILGSLLRALQPDTRFDSDPHHAAPPVDECLAASLKNGPHFILFDDMGLLWKPFLSRWIPDSRLNIAEITVESRTRLTDRVKALAAAPVQRRRLKASDFGVTTIDDEEPFVLLLDLRLFAGDQREDEADFVYQLKEAAECAAKAAHVKWPTIAESETKESIEAWFLKQSFSPAFRRTRSWLPRLISLVDPTLPIIIFSSTQDPEVLREFRPYGNIVTDFAKPMFRGALGETKEWAAASTLNFEKAMRYALSISESRKRLRRILESAEVSLHQTSDPGDCGTEATSPGAHMPQQPESGVPRQRTGPAKRVEIFIDESGTASQNRFAIGAVILLSGYSEFSHERYRQEAIDPNGVGLWGLDEVVRIRSERGLPQCKKLKKGRAISTGTAGQHDHNARLSSTLEAVEQLVKNQEGTLIACSLLSQDAPVPGDVASVRHPFHRYRDMLSRLLEGILFHLEPVAEAIKGGAEICVDAALAKNDADNWNLELLRDNFGAEFFDEIDDTGRRTERCRTLGRSHVLPLVAGLLIRYGKDTQAVNRREKDPAKKLLRARAVQLTNFEEITRNTLSREDRPDPKPLHHLADWIAHFTYDQRDWNEVPRIAVLSRWFMAGFRQVDEKAFKSQLRSHRRWSQDARIEAIRSWDSGATVNDDFSLTPRISRSAAKWMEALTADDLTTLFHSEVNP